MYKPYVYEVSSLVPFFHFTHVFSQDMRQSLHNFLHLPLFLAIGALPVQPTSKRPVDSSSIPRRATWWERIETCERTNIQYAVMRQVRRLIDHTRSQVDTESKNGSFQINCIIFFIDFYLQMHVNVVFCTMSSQS